MGNETGSILRRLGVTAETETVPKSGWTVRLADRKWIEDTSVVVDISPGKFLDRYMIKFKKFNLKKSECVLGDWMTKSTCSKECGGGFRKLTRRVGPGCEAEETWRMEHCNEHHCPGTIALYVLTSAVLLILVAVAGILWRRGYVKIKVQRGVPLITFPTVTITSYPVRYENNLE